MDKKDLIIDNEIKIEGVVNKLESEVEKLYNDLGIVLKRIQLYKEGEYDYLSTINSCGIIQGQGFTIDVLCGRLGELLIMKKNLK